jgi:hypothetical protein
MFIYRIVVNKYYACKKRFSQLREDFNPFIPMKLLLNGIYIRTNIYFMYKRHVVALVDAHVGTHSTKFHFKKVRLLHGNLPTDQCLAMRIESNKFSSKYIMTFSVLMN